MKLYTVVESCFDYDERSSIVVLITKSEEKAQEVALNLAQVNKDTIKLSKKLNDHFQKWRKDNPLPLLDKPFPEKVRWPAGLSKDKITEEMINERANWKKQTEELQKESAEIYRKYNENLSTERTKFLVAHGANENHPLNNNWFVSELSYSVEPVDFIDE